MVWFRVDDNLADHAKVRRIPRNQRVAAIGLWTLAGTWAARHLRDGQVPGYMVEELCAKPASADALVRVDLWHAHGHDCKECPPTDVDSFVFHDWASLQYTREQVLAKREGDAERQRQARERRKHEAEEQSSRDRHAVTDSDEGVSHATVQTPVPVPSRPVPSETSLEGERQETLRLVPATDAPKTKTSTCTRHPYGNPLDERCGGCKRDNERKQREADRAAEKAAREAEDLARNCVLCEGTHFVLDDNKLPTRRKCTTHRRAS